MDADDGSWVFDSLICFLNGPLWNAPLQSFIEEKSLIFEPNVKDNSEYKVIYEEFKSLVDLMLGTYMEDIGITPEQFETACSKQYTSELPLQFHKNLFEQIWAANDYNVFIRMMCQKNIELQLQALELIKSKPGLTTDLFSPSSSDQHYPEETGVDEVEDAFIMNEIKKQVASERQTPITATDEEIEQISTQFEHHLQDELLIKKHELDQALETAIIEKTASYDLSSENEEEKIVEVPKPTVKTIDKNPEPTQLKFNPKKIDEAELKKRQEYLKAQRDKLVALKKQVREKQLKNSIDAETTNAEKRPKSARVAEAMLGGNKSEIDSNALHIRRALAERLRAEVITHKD